MRNTIIAFSLLLAAQFARADVLVFNRVPVGKGYAGPVVVHVTWEDSSVRDVSGATGTLTVYSTAPSRGAGGTVLFAKTLAPAGTAGDLATTVSAANTATPGTYYAEIALVEGTITDTWHGTWVIEGR